MKKSDARVGMKVVHHLSGKPVGTVVTEGKTIVRADSYEGPITHWSELSPAPEEEMS